MTWWTAWWYLAVACVVLWLALAAGVLVGLAVLAVRRVAAWWRRRTGGGEGGPPSVPLR